MKTIIAILVIAVIGGVYYFASPSAKKKASKATSEIVDKAATTLKDIGKDAADNAADAAADAAAVKVEEGAAKVVGRLKDVRAQNNAKFAK